MKILQIFNRYRFRGGEEAWVEEIPKLLEGHHEIQDLRFKSEDWLGEGAPSHCQQIRLIGDNPESCAKLRDAVEGFKPDILLFHNVIPVGSLGLYFEARKLGIPVLQYTHNFRPFSPGGTLWNGRKMTAAALHGNPWPEILTGAWQGSRIKTAILAWHLWRARKHGLLECVSHWLAISEFMREQFIKAGISSERISVLRHCWPIPTSPAMAPERDYYLFLGRLVPEKGLDSLMRAWQLLERQLGDDCPRLVIAGSGSMEASLQEAAASMKQVEFKGFVEGEAKTTLIGSCRAMLVPSICWESLGLTVYEAYASQRPVIASRAGALQETVIDGHSGWSHEPDNPVDIARAVLEAERAAREKRTQFGANGHKWLMENADPVAWRKQFLLLCSKAIQSKGEKQI